MSPPTALFAGILWLIFVSASAPKSFADPSTESLKEIADTADRSCGTIAAAGETKSRKVTGDVKAQLSGLAAHLAELKVEGAAEIASDNYIGVLQLDLPLALKSTQECKLKVFDALQRKLIPESYPIELNSKQTTGTANSPGTSSSNTSGMGRSQDGLTVTLQSCMNVQLDLITCPITLVNTGPDRNVALLGSRESYIVDSNGIQQPPHIVRLGRQYGDMNARAGSLVANNVPVKGEISFGGTGERITGAPRVVIALQVRELNGSLPTIVLRWNDIPVLPP